MPDRRALFALFFLSGVAGLVYQVLWLRRLSLVFGVTVYAASTVLAAFMGGLAIGSLLAGRLLRRRVRPLQAFAVAEILVGVTGLTSPWLLDAAAVVYQQLHRAAPESLGWLTVGRLACSFAILAIPTTMMGTTLPLLAAAVSAVRTRVASGASIGALYAANTAGATAGTLAAGFFLIPAIGIQRTFFLTGAVNIAVGLAALWVSRERLEEQIAPPPAVPAVARPPLLATLYSLVAVSGFASLALEVLWFRLMLQFVSATSEAFAAMLATVLAGIAAGGYLGSRLLRRGCDPLLSLGVAQAATGVAVVAAMSALLWTVANGWDTMSVWRAVGIAILPPAVVMGLAFSLALGLVAAPASASDAAGLGARIGRLYAVNVIGAIAGSLAAGFLLIPWLGALSALVALAALYLLSAAVLAVTGGSRRTAAAVAVAVAAFVPLSGSLADPFKVAIDRRYGATLSEFWRHEGAQAAVSVRASRFQRVLYLDGLHQANDQPAMVHLHRTLGHLPMVLHGAAVDVLVVGMGGGATPGAVSQHAGARVQVVELSPSVVAAAPHFSHVNYDLLERDNVEIRVDDGRSFLAFTDRRFDVITADIIQPGHAGAGLVYSREYFSLVRRALKPGGVVLQWIGKRPSIEYKLIMRTFLDVFPHASLWNDGEFMVGTLQPLQLQPGTLDSLRLDRATRDALDAIGLSGFDVLRTWYTAGADQMRALAGPGPLLTDDRPLVEYLHWLPPASQQPPLDLSQFAGDVRAIVAGGGE